MHYRIEAIIRSDEDEGKFADEVDQLLYDTYKTAVEDVVVYAISR